MSNTASPRIAIIGGGPGGLVLLNVLARRGIAATLYERDESPAARGQVGSCLDLHKGSGQDAIKGAGLHDEWLKASRAEGEERIVTDKTGVAIIHHRPAATGKPEIDRKILRQLLVDGAPTGSIKWGHTFVSAAPVGDAWEVSFADGSKVTADLVVGADGGRSRVRPLVSDAQIVHTGWTTVELAFDSRAQPDLAARLGSGTFFAIDEHKRIVAQFTGDARIHIGATFPAPESFVVPVDNAAAAKSLVLAQFEGWAPWLRDLIACAEDGTIHQRPLTILPVGHTWPHKKGVTLIGDAANLMSTFAAAGANIAMLAGLELGQALATASPGRWDEHVAQFEVKMCRIAGEAAAQSDKNMKEVLGDGGAQMFAARVKRNLLKLGIEPYVG
ncbi:FAD-dependent oxidoreductase [Exidia glandulosa HHB12029]|uniref:FAD-dependent oxidoreductase n=1 Tax=Exidia glandulosa HHB12029 TaxID=1314781 RepID=A0A165CW17_EXIGL|nr:FAD-dependent oxidoreductase [Exidia glandulosa HHB12029]